VVIGDPDGQTRIDNEPLKDNTRQKTLCNNERNNQKKRCEI
jgi:hypothetical protein